jgi:alkylhydroperoxidase family enzyme
VSGQSQGVDVDLSGVNAPAGDGGVAHGARLLAFTDAAMGSDDAALARERRALRELLSDEQLVDTCAVISAFNVVDRIADATGIPLDPPLAAMSAAVRSELDLGRFASSANTPG